MKGSKPRLPVGELLLRKGLRMCVEMCGGLDSKTLQSVVVVTLIALAYYCDADGIRDRIESSLL
jgi:hypothetical protein